MLRTPDKPSRLEYHIEIIGPIDEGKVCQIGQKYIAFKRVSKHYPERVFWIHSFELAIKQLYKSTQLQQLTLEQLYKHWLIIHPSKVKILKVTIDLTPVQIVVE